MLQELKYRYASCGCGLEKTRSGEAFYYKSAYDLISLQADENCELFSLSWMVRNV